MYFWRFPLYLYKRAAHGPNELDSQKYFFSGSIIPIPSTSRLALEYKPKIKILEHPSVNDIFLAVITVETEL